MQGGGDLLIYVVFDSSVIVKDFRFRSIHFRTLLERSKREALALAVPKVVFEEVTNKWREEIGSLVASVRNNMSRLGMEPETIILPDPEQQADSYAKWLRGHLNAHKVQILELPDVSHEALLRTALQKRKPFNVSGAGYRDALIWESVKQLAKESQGEVIFVSHDKNDFSAKEGNNSGGLHSDLIWDLREARLNEDQITLITKGVSAVVEKVVTPAEAALKWLTDKLRDDQAYKDTVLASLKDNLDRSMQIPDQDLRGGGVVREIKEVWLNPDSAQVVNAWVLGRFHIGVELTIEAEVNALLDVHAPGFRVFPENGQLDPLNGDSVVESQAVRGYVNGQLEISDKPDSDKIFDSYAYVARVSDGPELTSRSAI
jgi:hypothetical protein